MFTTIVEERGRVRRLDVHDGGARVEIDATTVLDDAVIGASIAVNGCCLTVVAFDDHSWCADAVIETLARTNLGDLAPGAAVNLERPVRLADRLGGHLVQGHVDGVAIITERVPGDLWETVRFTFPSDLARYVVHKGSITVDGISLTVTEIDEDRFAVSLIPTTLELTTLGRKGVGEMVNIEVDIVAKYIEKLVIR